MGMTIGGIDPVNEIVDLQVRINTLERLLDLSIGKGLNLSPAEIIEARKQAVQTVKDRYPHLGLELKNA